MGSISIIGLGNMASALAGRALDGGNAVEIIGRDPAKAKALAATLGGATVGTAGSAVAVISHYGEALHGKVVIDITNPITPDFTGFVAPDGSSGAHVVKAFNTLPSDVLAAGSVEGRPVDVFIVGDDVQAKARVSVFIESLGMHPMGAGQLPMARALENATLLQLGLITHSGKNTNLFLGVSILS
ncbi:MAG: NAD(P)-binding domain-containing protein [Mycobacterium sp.]|nr:NAD(P)-binding domain-containing protein [Mycobacterium sp.]